MLFSKKNLLQKYNFLYNYDAPVKKAIFIEFHKFTLKIVHKVFSFHKFTLKIVQ